jgi:hypothetical protein
MEQQQNKNNTETKWRSHRQILFQNTVKITKKKCDIKYTYIMQNPYKKQ